MRVTWPEIREFLRPIPDSDLPRLQRLLYPTVRGLSLLFGALSLLFLPLQMALGMADTLRDSLRIAAGVLFYFALYVAARRRTLAPDVLLMAMAFLIMSTLSFEGWVSGHHSATYSAYATVIPLFIAAFIPWRPSLSLILILPALVGPALIAPELDPSLTESRPMFLFGAVCAGLVAAGANQVQRRFLLALERAKGRLAASERMSSLGRLAASMAHELKTPIGASLNASEMLARLNAELGQSIGHPGVGEDDLREISREIDASLATLNAALARAGRYVSAVREQCVSAVERPSIEFSVAERVALVVTLLAPVLRRARVTVAVDVAPEVGLMGDPGKFDQILLNLLQNAVDAIAPAERGGSIEVRAERRAEGLCLHVADDGPGVPDELRERIFAPLFTTRLDGGGTGLGLAIARDIAHANFGGSLVLAASERGAHFELFCRHAAPSPPPSSALSGRGAAPFAWRNDGVALPHA